MPQNIMMTADEAALIDTDPRSRQALAKLVKQYQGMEWKDARSGMRMHISHDVGEYALKEAQKEAVESYASELVDNAEVVVMGFADGSGESSANVRISKKGPMSLLRNFSLYGQTLRSHRCHRFFGQATRKMPGEQRWLR